MLGRHRRGRYIYPAGVAGAYSRSPECSSHRDGGPKSHSWASPSHDHCLHRLPGGIRSFLPSCSAYLAGPPSFFESPSPSDLANARKGFGADEVRETAPVQEERWSGVDSEEWIEEIWRQRLERGGHGHFLGDRTQGTASPILDGGFGLGPLRSDPANSPCLRSTGTQVREGEIVRTRG